MSRQYRGPVEERVCAGCAGPFLTNHPTRRYCSEPCRRLTYVRRWREQNPERHLEVARENNRASRQRDPEKHRAWARRWPEQHPDEHRESGRRWAKANPEKVRDAWRRHVAAHPEKRREFQRRYQAQKLGVTIGEVTPELVAAKSAYWFDRCWICGGPNQAADHVKPMRPRRNKGEQKQKGGANMIANLRPICTSCNSHKGNYWPNKDADGNRRPVAETLADVVAYVLRLRGLA